MDVAPLFVHRFDGMTDVARAILVIPSDGGQAAVPVRDVSAIEPRSEGLFVALEAEATREIVDTMRKLSEKTYEDGGHALRSVHAKTHGLLQAE